LSDGKSLGWNNSTLSTHLTRRGAMQVLKMTKINDDDHDGDDVANDDDDDDDDNGNDHDDDDNNINNNSIRELIIKNLN